MHTPSSTTTSGTTPTSKALPAERGTFRHRSGLKPWVAGLCTIWFMAGVNLPASTLTFEGLADLQQVNDFYPGVTFSNAVSAIAGVSLNELEVPPVSGVTVALNDGGPMRIQWDSPVSNFNAFFTYTAPLNLTFFLAGIEIKNATTAFTNNLALSGDPGSSPNESIALTGVSFDSLRIETGGGFGVDDLSFDPGNAAVPEPGTAMTGLGALMALLYAARRRK